MPVLFPLLPFFVDLPFTPLWCELPAKNIAFGMIVPQIRDIFSKYGLINPVRYTSLYEIKLFVLGTQAALAGYLKSGGGGAGGHEFRRMGGQVGYRRWRREDGNWDFQGGGIQEKMRKINFALHNSTKKWELLREGGLGVKCMES